MKLPVVIQGTERRRSMIDYLCHHLPQATVVLDTEHRPMDTFLRSLVASDDGHLHLEDDVTLSQPFMEQAESIVNQGTTVVQFFSRLKEDAVKGTRRRPGSSWMYNVCMWLPAGMGQEIVDYYPHWKDRDLHPGGFDYLIAEYLKATKQSYLNIVPTLVQHTPLPTTLTKRARDRSSSLFVGNALLEHHPCPQLIVPA